MKEPAGTHGYAGNTMVCNLHKEKAVKDQGPSAVEGANAIKMSVRAVVVLTELGAVKAW